MSKLNKKKKAIYYRLSDHSAAAFDRICNDSGI